MCVFSSVFHSFPFDSSHLSQFAKWAIREDVPLSGYTVNIFNHYVLQSFQISFAAILAIEEFKYSCVEKWRDLKERVACIQVLHGKGLLC